MAMDFKTETLQVGGMSCVNCEGVIQKKLRGTAGIKKAEANYAAGTVRVMYDAGKITLEQITALIGDVGYQARVGAGRPQTDVGRVTGTLVIIAAVYVILQYFGILNFLVPSRLAGVDMGYGLIFMIGLATSVHCVAMCGGINLSQCLPRGVSGENAGTENAKSVGGQNRISVLRPSVLYNGGRIISYTIVGFIVGSLGSAVTFSLSAQGALKAAAGAFMILMGVNMLNLFPALRKFMPRMPKFIAGKAAGAGNGRGPLAVGLLNGLMPCGPLQAMQLYALSTGSPLKGALSMMLFSIGTVPLMFGLGTFTSAAGKKSAKRVMAAGAVMVTVLGLCMVTQGWNLFGGLPTGAAVAAQAPKEEKKESLGIDLGPQIIKSTLSGYGYPNITVEAGRPVKWIINAPPGSINGCNYRFVVREYGIAYEFRQGENVVEFTPSRVGKIPYTCWMGMIPGTITVVSPGGGGAAPNTDERSFYEDGGPPKPRGCCRVPKEDA